MAFCAGCGETRNGDLLAPQRIPLVLEVEKQESRTRKASARLRSSGTDSKNEPGESALGSAAYPWGLLKLGIEVSQATVAKYMARQRKPPSQTWRTFLNNHVRQLVSTDFFVVPTVTFRVLYVFIGLAHNRRRLVHFNVTAYPTSEWTTQQIVEAFSWGNAPRYLLHDRDSIYEGSFRQRVQGMTFHEVLMAPRSPWQSPYVERIIGSIRRECLDHMVVFNESSLHRILKSYTQYYLHSRTHLALAKDAPEARPIQWPQSGVVVEIPEVGGLHHRYERRAA